MRFQIFLALGFIAVACASPLIDKKKDASPLRVIDIPADLFADAAENTEDVKEPQEASDALPAEVPKEEKVDPVASALPVDDKTDVELVTPTIEGDKSDANETEEADRPNIFGFRLPTIVILRRPAVFDDPFSFFPFSISSFNRRPGFSPRPIVPLDNRRDEEDTPSFAAVSPSEQRPVSIGGGPGISDMMHNVRQQMDSLFSSLFAPAPQYIPNNRPFFRRPLFPPVSPFESSAEDSKEFLDFDKLPNNYKNSTSETKVVDGQVIQVNKTVHKISGNNSNGFFQFSVIKIRPSDSTIPEEEKPEEASNNVPPAVITDAEETKPEVTTIKAAQEAEMSNPSLNEVDQEEKDMTKTRYETDAGLLEEPINTPVSLPLTQEVVYDFVPVKSLPLIQATKGNKGSAKPHDLSSDLRVNNLMAKEDSGRLRSLVDSDEVEIIEV